MAKFEQLYTAAPLTFEIFLYRYRILVPIFDF